MRFPTSRIARAAAIGALAVAAITATAPGAHADPSRGGNSTPGYLTCGADTFAITSGSDLANSIQLVDDQRLFVVQSIPEFNFYIAIGFPPDQILDCVLDEASYGHPIALTGALTQSRTGRK